jgi:hypothetical protein
LLRGFFSQDEASEEVAWMSWPVLGWSDAEAKMTPSTSFGFQSSRKKVPQFHKHYYR